MPPSGRTGDALDDLECILDSLPKVVIGDADEVVAIKDTLPPADFCEAQEQETRSKGENDDETQAIKASMRMKSKKAMRENTAKNTRRKNDSRAPRAAQKRPPKDKNRAQRCPPTHSIRKTNVRNQKERVDGASNRIRGTLCENSGDPTRNSSQEKDDQQFLQNLQRMAEQRQQIEKRRCVARNAQIEKKMKVILGTAEQSMREIVRSTASKISKTARSVVNMMPKALDKELEMFRTMLAEDKKLLNTKTDSVTTVSGTLQNELKDLRMQLKANENGFDEKIQNATAHAKRSILKRRDFRGSLIKVEHILKKSGKYQE